jgi:hypothetical protein
MALEVFLYGYALTDFLVHVAVIKQSNSSAYIFISTETGLVNYLTALLTF